MDLLRKFFNTSLIFLLLLLIGCVGLDTPQKLGEEQWEACSHYPSVELVTITATGQVLVRDLQYSAPPASFQHCMSRIAYKQVLSGRRNAETLIRDAYFTDTAPERGSLSKPAGQYPERVNQFSPNQTVYFFFGMERSDFPFQVSFDWISPSGDTTSTSRRITPGRDTYPYFWSVERFDLTSSAKGNWMVSMYVEKFHAGDYSFFVD